MRSLENIFYPLSTRNHCSGKELFQPSLKESFPSIAFRNLTGELFFLFDLLLLLRGRTSALLAGKIIDALLCHVVADA